LEASCSKFMLKSLNAFLKFSNDSLVFVTLLITKEITFLKGEGPLNFKFSSVLVTSGMYKIDPNLVCPIFLAP